MNMVLDDNEHPENKEYSVEKFLIPEGAPVEMFEALKKRDHPENKEYSVEKFLIPEGTPVEMFEALKKRDLPRLRSKRRKFAYVTPGCQIQACELTPDVLTAIHMAQKSWIITAKYDLGFEEHDFDVNDETSWVFSEHMCKSDRVLMRRLLWTGDFREDGIQIPDSEWLDEDGSTLFS